MGKVASTRAKKTNYLARTKLHRHSSLFWNSRNQLLRKGIVIWWATAKWHFQPPIYLNVILTSLAIGKTIVGVNHMYRTTLIQFINNNDGTFISTWQWQNQHVKTHWGLNSLFIHCVLIGLLWSMWRFVNMFLYVVTTLRGLTTATSPASFNYVLCIAVQHRDGKVGRGSGYS